MNSFHMWQDKIIFKDGWYLFLGGKGNNSVITSACARRMEEEYNRYQAGMDVDRGGIDPNIAFPNRGFKKVGHTYEYDSPYVVDALSGGREENRIEKKLVIPSEVDGIPITCVCKNAFANIKSLEEVDIPDGVETIGGGAFFGCASLQKVNLPQRQIQIAEDAFENTPIGKACDGGAWYLGHHFMKADKELRGVFQIEEGTLSVADCAFKDCINIEKIVLPDSVQSIGRNAFAGCTGLKEIVMPETLNALGAGAFSGCGSLSTAAVSQGISRLERGVFKNCVSLREISLPDTLESISFDCFENTEIMNAFQYGEAETLYIGKWLICCRPEFEGELIVRDGTVGIADYDCMSQGADRRNLSAVVLPETMRYIGMEAFCRCAKLESVHLPEGIVSLGQSAFRDCKSLKNIVIPESVQNVEQWAFMGCESIESITFLNAQTKIVWPAITNRRDAREIKIIADVDSEAKRYCREYGEKNHLRFEKRKKNFIGRMMNKIKN